MTTTTSKVPQGVSFSSQLVSSTAGSGTQPQVARASSATQKGKPGGSFVTALLRALSALAV